MMPHSISTQLTVRISDINYGGHLAHDRLVSLLHQARCDFLAHFSASEANFFGTGLIMRTLHVDYLAEAFYGDNLLITMHVTESGHTWFILEYHVQVDDKTIATAQTKMVAFDYHKRRVAALPKDWRHLTDKQE
ncbi:acyl-CoA thioesterase [Dichelobacter nodosus]|uniref:Thioesterase family domain protein n=1 Tax=Dichelobacter nodosus (strain VCS1703A) TaxID=246195 RepID=A5EVH0_DICNV|nr:thioesterase family protein [Dichelobacter nodosus]ABQ13506.1 thioesterase family domain protein [Dichelobacter nodosus VCS1703A]KNZ39819.1 thioesterase [Dichelobacter nodosus]